MPLAAPLNPLRCNNPDCTLPQGGRCARIAEFTSPEADCLDLARITTGVPVEDTQSAPWSGRHLPPAEAARLLWRSPARLIAVLGPFNAGKTSLLTSFFLQLANGQRDNLPYRFASSLTLHGFRELAERASRWSGESSENIVDHTAKEDSALPGYFLHLGFRPENPADDRHVDLLLSDIAGEWAKEWTGEENETALRRMSFIPRCDAFLILADAGALMGEGGHKVDGETSLFIRRVIKSMQDALSSPPIALVFSKFDSIARDIPPPPEGHRLEPQAWGKLAARARRTWIAVREATDAGFPVEIFPVSAFPNSMAEGQPAGVMAPFTWIMKHVDRRQRWPAEPLPVPEGATGFATMRRWRDEP